MNGRVSGITSLLAYHRQGTFRRSCYEWLRHYFLPSQPSVDLELAKVWRGVKKGSVATPHWVANMHGTV